MLISQIEYLNKTTGVINGQNIMTISLRESSQTNSTISSISWAFGVISGPGTASLSNATDKDVCLIIDNTLDITVSITLTVSDNDGFTSQSRIRIIKSTADVIMQGLLVDSFILPDGLVEFTPIDNVVIIDGSPVINSPAFTEYWFDKENDAVWDIQDNSGVIPTFSNIYTVLTNVKAKIANTNALVFNEISFKPIIENPRNLVIDSSNDCKILTAYSETKNYLPKLVNRGNLDNSEMSCLQVTLTTNCCTANEIVYDLPPTYDLSLSQGVYTPSSILIDYFGTGINYYVNLAPITINGIDASLIDTIQYTNRGEVSPLYSISNTNVFNLEVLIETDDPNPPGYPITGSEVPQTNRIIITTKKGFVYEIEYLLDNPYGGVPLQMTLSIISITYPEYPCGITIVNEPSNTVLIVDSHAFNLNDCDNEIIALPDGIYQITLNDSGISNETISNCLFVDCETYCLIIKALANNCSSTIGILYDALSYSKNCDNVSCQNLCDLYETLMNFLEDCDCTIFQNNIVNPSSNCGCS